MDWPELDFWLARLKMRPQIMTAAERHQIPVQWNPTKRDYSLHQALPMSFGQQRMWLSQQTLPDPATYNLPIVYRLHGLVDVERLRQSLEVIQQRHEVLRTSLVQEGGELFQRISPTAQLPLPWEEVDLQAVPADQ